MEYQPGVCNIGREERRKRRVAGLLGFAAAAAVLVAVATGPVPAVYSLVASAFFFGGFVGVYQDYFRFCVAFGALARYDLTGSGGEAGSVAEREAVERDRKRAAQILGYALVSTVVATGLGYGFVVALS